MNLTSDGEEHSAAACLLVPECSLRWSDVCCVCHYSSYLVMSFWLHKNEAKYKRGLIADLIPLFLRVGLHNFNPNV